MRRFRFGEVRRNKPLLVLVLPLIVAVFLVGWFMYVIGQDLASKGAKSGIVVKFGDKSHSECVEVLTVEQ